MTDQDPLSALPENPRERARQIAIWSGMTLSHIRVTAALIGGSVHLYPIHFYDPTHGTHCRLYEDGGFRIDSRFPPSAAPWENPDAEGLVEKFDEEVDSVVGQYSEFGRAGTSMIGEHMKKFIRSHFGVEKTEEENG